MAVSNPEQTRHLLLNNPSLTYAVFHAMVMMNLIDPSIVQVRLFWVRAVDVCSK